MIFQNIEFHNVREIKPSDKCEGGYTLYRVPLDVAEKLSEGAQEMNWANTGVELRFCMQSDEVELEMMYDRPDVTRPLVFYGQIPAGWPECVKTIYNHPSKIVIKKPKPEEMEAYKRIAKENNHVFDPEVIRVIMQNNPSYFIGVKGDVTPPTEGMLPKKKYLAYGSSITHGSLALCQANTYAMRVSQNFGADLYNFGFAGNAQVRPDMADYIANELEWDFATLEMGINILGMAPEEFEKRVEYFVKTVAGKNPDKTVFCIDVYYCMSDLYGDGKAARFREIVRDVVKRLGLKNTVYLNGLDLMGSSDDISGDLVHPNIRGVEKLASNLTAAMKEYIK